MPTRPIRKFKGPETRRLSPIQRKVLYILTDKITDAGSDRGVFSSRQIAAWVYEGDTSKSSYIKSMLDALVAKGFITKYPAITETGVHMGQLIILNDPVKMSTDSELQEIERVRSSR